MSIVRTAPPRREIVARQRIRQADAGGFRLTEARYAPGTWIEPHAHASAHIFLTLSGGTMERTGQRNVAVGPGQLLVRDAEVVHSNMIGPAGAHVLIIEWTGGGSGPLAHLAAAAATTDTLPAGGVMPVCHELLAERWSADAGTAMVLEGQVLEIVGRAIRASRPVESGQCRWLAAARDRMLCALADPPSIAELAAEAGVHPGHFHRAFRRAYGTTPAAAVQRARIAAAKAMLRDDGLPLATIASRLGYADRSHFGRTFRALTGMSPGAWRASVAAPAVPVSGGSSGDRRSSTGH